MFTYRKGEDKLVGKEPVRKGKGPRPVPEPVQDIHKAFNSALERAGIRDFHFHDLRHTFASQLAMRGASLKDLQELLGHKDPRMTARYAHLSQEHKQKSVNLLVGLTSKEDTSESFYVTKCHKIVIHKKTAGKPFRQPAVFISFFWSGREDLNLRHPAPKAGALPDCATPRWFPPRSVKRLQSTIIGP